MSDNIQELPVAKIDDPPAPMRSSVREEDLFNLAANIKANGLINPITVRPVGDRYQVVAGHRRLCAVRINGSPFIRCVVRELSDAEVFAIMVAENLERKDVDLLDEAATIKSYMETSGLDHKDTARAIQRTPKYVLDRLAIVDMPEYMRGFLKNKEIPLGVALALNTITNDALKENWTLQAKASLWSVSFAEYQVRNYHENKQMFDNIITETSVTDERLQVKPIMFRCALDGKEYDARLVKYVPIYEGNLEFIDALRVELSAEPAKIESTPAE